MWRDFALGRKGELTKDPAFIAQFGCLIMNWSYGGEERHQEWPGDEKALELVGNYVDAEWLTHSGHLNWIHLRQAIVSVRHFRRGGSLCIPSFRC